jgi:hypothetical protein
MLDFYRSVAVRSDVRAVSAALRVTVSIAVLLLLLSVREIHSAEGTCLKIATGPEKETTSGYSHIQEKQQVQISEMIDLV